MLVRRSPSREKVAQQLPESIKVTTDVEVVVLSLRLPLVPIHETQGEREATTFVLHKWAVWLFQRNRQVRVQLSQDLFDMAEVGADDGDGLAVVVPWQLLTRSGAAGARRRAIGAGELAAAFARVSLATALAASAAPTAALAVALAEGAAAFTAVVALAPDVALAAEQAESNLWRRIGTRCRWRLVVHFGEFVHHRVEFRRLDQACSRLVHILVAEASGVGWGRTLQLLVQSKDDDVDDRSLRHHHRQSSCMVDGHSELTKGDMDIGRFFPSTLRSSQVKSSV